MANVPGPFTMLFHNPSPGCIFLTFSTNEMLFASGALVGSCATRAATYASVASIRHWRSHATWGAAGAAEAEEPMSAVAFAGGLLQAPSTSIPTAAAATALNFPKLLISMKGPHVLSRDGFSSSSTRRRFYSLISRRGFDAPQVYGAECRLQRPSGDLQLARVAVHRRLYLADQQGIRLGNVLEGVGSGGTNCLPLSLFD